MNDDIKQNMIIKELQTALVHEKRYSEQLYNTLMMIPRAVRGQDVDLDKTSWSGFVTDVQKLRKTAVSAVHELEAIRHSHDGTLKNKE